MVERTCAQCGTVIRHEGRGRPKRWCSDRCRLAWHRDDRRRTYTPGAYADRTCCTCGDPMKRGTGTLPQGQAECRPCRRKWARVKPEPFSEQRICPSCGYEFEAKRSTQKYCTPQCRNKKWGRGGTKVGTTTERGYGAKHQREKKLWGPGTNRWTGVCAEPVCLMPTRWLDPNARWDLAHDHVNGGYLGPAHPKCNRTEGAKRSSGSGWADRLTKVLSRTCPTCGVAFETRYPRQRYCNPKCRPR